MLSTVVMVHLSVSSPATGAIASDLEQAVSEAADSDHSTAITRLRAAIEKARNEAKLEPMNEVVAPHLLNAYVLLVRLYLANGEAAMAQQTMDELIEIDGEGRAPVRSFGPQVVQLYEERRLVVKERTELRIEVTPPSDESSVVPSEHEPSASPASTTVSVAPSPISAPKQPLEPRSRPVHAPAHRLAERRLEIIGAAIGLAALAAGATLLSLDNTCSTDAKDATAVTPCTRAQDTAGAVLTAAGGVILATSAVFISIDEVRIGHRNRQAMLTATFRF